MVIWLTGLSGAGKTTIATRIYEKINTNHNNVVLLDGDILREVLGSYGYSREERLSLAKKISNLCNFLAKQNLIVICATIGLFKEIHQLNREKMKEYYEIYIDVEMKELIRRDKNNLYTNALTGKEKNVVGVDIAYDKPEKPYLIIDNNQMDKLDEKANKIIEMVFKNKIKKAEG